MGFIHGDQLNIQGGEIAGEQIGLQPFRGYVQEFTIAITGHLKSVDQLFAVHAGVEEKGGDIFSFQAVGLVFHQGDQRADHET